MIFDRPMVRVALVVVSVVAAVSVGGGFAAGIVLAPMLMLAARHTGVAAATGLVVLAGVLVAEVAWALTYLLAGEAQPLIWLVPTLAGAGAVVAGAWTRSSRAAAGASLANR